MVNSYLFWGVRGAGQNFGVVIEATLETYPKTNGGDFYNADMTFAEGHLDSVIDAMNSLYPLDDDGFAHFLCGLCHNPREGKKFTEMFSPFCTSLNESIIPWDVLNSQSRGDAILAKCIPGQSHNQNDPVTKVVDKATFDEFVDSFAALWPNN
ncbi:MAG: hypothetical protein LQ343_007718 [Gyalolechia ehrenbergii]|nr:MAG: hypothetical protein LQ343_007718 [Gyalolechia ehrenbergii]